MRFMITCTEAYSVLRGNDAPCCAGMMAFLGCRDLPDCDSAGRVLLPTGAAEALMAVKGVTLFRRNRWVAATCDNPRAAAASAQSYIARNIAPYRADRGQCRTPQPPCETRHRGPRACPSARLRRLVRERIVDDVPVRTSDLLLDIARKALAYRFAGFGRAEPPAWSMPFCFASNM